MRITHHELTVEVPCEGCMCHELDMTFGTDPDWCAECGCPKTPAALDLYADLHPDHVIGNDASQEGGTEFRARDLALEVAPAASDPVFAGQRLPDRDRRALGLLRGFLDEAQLAQLDRTGGSRADAWFDATGSLGGRYRIFPHLPAIQGRSVTGADQTLCISSRPWVPPADQALAWLLLLSRNEGTFRLVMNRGGAVQVPGGVTWYGDPMRPAVPHRVG